MAERSEPAPIDSTTDFAEFYAREISWAARLAHLVSGSLSGSVDIAQDAMVVLHRRWLEVENPKGFLRVTVLNLCRRRRRRAFVERRWLLRRQELAVSGDVIIDELWGAVRRLPQRQREVVALRFYEDLTIEQIAGALDVPIGTVKSALHRALQRLKDELT